MKPEELDIDEFSDPSALNSGDDEYVDPGEVGEDAEQEQMDAMMDQYLDSMGTATQVGESVKAPIIAIQGDQVLLDLGAKAEGAVPLRELTNADGEMPYSVGDEIDVLIKGMDSETGMFNVSHSEAKRRAAHQAIQEALDASTSIEGKIVRAVKGGLIVDLGTTAFLPASQIDLRRVENMEDWIGRTVQCLVLEFSPRQRRIVVSRRKLLEIERVAKRGQLLEELAVGQVISGCVKRIVDFGAFVDLGGLDGLVPRGEISWHRNASPSAYLKPEQEVEVKVIGIDREKGRVTLSRKQMTPDPWDTVEDRYSQGAVVPGEIVSLTDYGAFVRLEEGLDGMIHIKDIAWDSDGKRPADFLSVSQTVQVEIMNVDVAGRKLSLGLKQLTDDPWVTIRERYPTGTVVKGRVTGLKNYGAFVEIEPGIRGMIHVSDFSWDKRIDQPHDVVSKGDEIEARVLSIDLQKRHIKLGVKQLAESPLEAYANAHKTGEVVKGKVTDVSDYGIQVQLDEDARGFIHVSQLDTSRVESPSALFKVGDEVEAEIMKIDSGSNEIRLSRRQMLKRQDKRVAASYMKRDSDPGVAKLGDLMADLKLEDELPPE